MATVTQLVCSIMENEEYFDEITDPEDAIQALASDEFFQNPSNRLRDVLGELGYPDPDTVIEKLLQLEEEIDPSITEETLDNKKKMIKRWFNNNKSPNRENAIKLCFALSLNADQSARLFSEGIGCPFFNVRNLDEAIFLYALLKKKTFVDAFAMKEQYYILCEQYHNTDAEPAPLTVQKPTHQTGETTYYLRTEIKDGSWDSDEEFLHEFLLPNRELFTSYSKTFFREYTRINAELSRKIVDKEPEKHMKRILKYIENHPENKYLSQKGAEIKAIQKTKNPNEFWEKYSDDFFALAPEFRLPIGSIWEALNLPQKKSGDSMLSLTPASALKNFPHRQYVQEIEKTLQNINQGKRPERPNQVMSLKYRKILLTLFYFNYIFDWILDDGEEVYKTFADYGNYKVGFLYEVTDLLYRCNMTLLCKKDRFDWLIMKSIRECENEIVISDCSEVSEIDVAGNYLSEILELSYSDI